MFENLKIALRRQKKLLLIFFLTIFIPSITLSIFGLRAIKNEQFRQAEQTVNDHRGIADLLISQVLSRIEDLDFSLRSLAMHPSFQKKVLMDMQKLIFSRLADESLLGEVFIVYKDEKPLFPLFQPMDSLRENFPSFLSPNQRAKLSEAEDREYRQKNYKRAIAIYESLLSSGGNDSFKAEMLNNLARCFMKLGSFLRAVQFYTRVLEEYPAAVSSSGLPLGIAAGPQILECYRKLNDPQKFLEAALKLYKDILQKPWNLSKDQYNLYSSMVQNTLEELLANPQNELETKPYENEFSELINLHQKYKDKWGKVEGIKQEIIPELERMLESPDSNLDLSFHRSFAMDGKDLLVIGSWIFGMNSDSERKGMIAAEINDESLKEKILSKALFPSLEGGDMNVIISNIQGKELIGKTDPRFSVATVTSFFKDNFPPWKMEFFRTKPETNSLSNLSKSFYFWTILTLFLILTFGAILISRTLSQEIGILKIKSDFVSSVSHELKTPLTSIKALIERLKEGKVKDPYKMLEYYSIISHDTEKLTRLVKNILDFSRIEEGKIEYKFEETDIKSMITQQIEAFQQDEVHKQVKMNVHMAENIPIVQADKDALALAIDNLLNNAIKFSPEKPEIFVDVRCEGDSLKISVKDKGIGIPEDETDKIFDKFYQGKNARSLTVKGTGLGLTLVRHTAEAHGGKVSAESQPGKGSNFSLLLPLNIKEK